MTTRCLWWSLRERERKYNDGRRLGGLLFREWMLRGPVWSFEIISVVSCSTSISYWIFSCLLLSLLEGERGRGGKEEEEEGAGRNSVLHYRGL